MTSLATIRNPFRASIVSDPWKSLEANVPTIHQLAFTRCCEAINHVRTQHQTTGVLVHGEAGSGKTHLLARLHAHIAREAEADGPGGLEEAIFISAQLQTSAKMIWRHLRRRLAADLLRRESTAVTQFERLLMHQLTKNNLAADNGQAWLEQVRKEAHGAEKLAEALDQLFDRIDSRGQIGYKLRQVIAALLLKKHFSEASAWLRGESLPKASLQKLGIDSSAGNDEEAGEAEGQDDQDSYVVFGLCSLATAELPLIICFDQIEALQTSADDRAGLVAFGQMVYDLHAFTQHLLLISCIQSAFYDQLGQAVRQADFARIRAFAEVTLNPLTREEALQLVAARLDALPELGQLRGQQANPLWPLQEAEISSVFTATGTTARRLLFHCADLYEAHRPTAVAGDPSQLPPVPVNQFLDQELEKRRQQALEESEPAETEEIIKHGLLEAIHLAGNNWQQQEQGLPSEVDTLFAGLGGRVAVSVCNSRHWPSLVKKLSRLNAQMDKKQTDKLVLLRDGRLPIGSTAVKTRFLREQLIQKGARWIEPSVEALAALDALRRLLADARSGDLANRGETVELKTVQDWFAANLTTELRDLLEEVLPTDPGKPPIIIDDWSLYEDIAELLQRHQVISVAKAAAHLERAEVEIAECAQQHAHQLGLLGEPPAVLFRLVSAGLTA
jgi:hypothetical protein